MKKTIKDLKLLDFWRAFIYPHPFNLNQNVKNYNLSKIKPKVRKMH